MLEVEIPFEIHLTTTALTPDQVRNFVNFCLENNCKPLIIDLSKGNFNNQPMLSVVVCTKNITDVFHKANTLSVCLSEKGFPTKRIKIEIPSTHFKKFKDFQPGFEKYFEWHCKVDYINVTSLNDLCDRYNVHLSKNSLKNENSTRFITLREFSSLEDFERRIDQVIYELNRGNWTIRKQESEYCLYDSNSILDNGWIN